MSPHPSRGLQIHGRVRPTGSGTLADDAPVHEGTIFGGLAFLFNGNMFCGIVHDALLLRLGPDGVQRAVINAACGRSLPEAMSRRNRRAARTADRALCGRA
jgi:hypothetical protein